MMIHNPAPRPLSGQWLDIHFNEKGAIDYIYRTDEAELCVVAADIRLTILRPGEVDTIENRRWRVSAMPSFRERMARFLRRYLRRFRNASAVNR